MTEHEQKAIDMLQLLCDDHIRDIEQLEEVSSRLRERYAKLYPERFGNKHIYAILEHTADGIASVEEALNKIREAREKMEEFIPMLQEFFEVKF